MKKLIAMMLAVLTACSMAACAKKEEPQVEPEIPESVDTVQKPNTNVEAVGGDDAAAVAQQALDARNEFSYSGVLALVHGNYVKNVAARLRMDAEEMFRMYDENAAGIRQETEKDKGEFTPSSQIGQAAAVEGDELTALQERYEDLYELTVTQAVQVPFSVTAEYESGNEVSEETMVIVEIDGKWYLDLASIKLM